MAKYRPPLQTELKEIAHSSGVQKLIDEGKIPPVRRFKAGLTYIAVFPPFETPDKKRGWYMDFTRKDRYPNEKEIREYTFKIIPNNTGRMTTRDGGVDDNGFFHIIVEETPLPTKEEVEAVLGGQV